ncbi:glycosyltransferase family 2 protein [Pseudoalteromonas xiamenensis]
MVNKISFDLILTTVDKKKDVLKLFHTLARQSDDFKLRVLFADQSEDINWNDIKNFESENLEIIHKKISKSSLSKARNIAVSLGLKSDYIAFPDDDCWYKDSILSDVYEKFTSDTSLDVVCTNVYDPDTKRYYGDRPVVNNVDVSFKNIFKYPISVGIFMKKSVFVATGGRFDERFGVGAKFGSGEETLLIAQVISSGAKIQYFGEVKVFHPVLDSAFYDISKSYSYGVGFGKLNQEFFKSGNYSVLPYFIYVIYRTIGGCLTSLFNTPKRKVYSNRLKGVLRGFLLTKN